MSRSDQHMRACLFAIGLGVFAIGPAAVLAAGQPRPGAPVLVIGPGAAETVAAAGGQVIGPVQAPLAVLAAGTDDGLIARLQAQGAWAVLDGDRVAALCGL